MSASKAATRKQLDKNDLFLAGYSIIAGVLMRFGAFKVPMNTKDARYSTAYSGPSKKHTEVFA
jgi:hypothetical protein